jgi:hypothetical protein
MCSAAISFPSCRKRGTFLAATLFFAVRAFKAYERSI